MTLAIVHTTRQTARVRSLEAFAAAAGVHPRLVARFVALGLLDPVPGAGGAPEFPDAQLARLARIRRLHAELPLNYAALGVVLDLLARIEELEAQLRHAHPDRPDRV
ncbi:chaperone modulator CbpM [Dactylosporangium sp. NPDC000244]|uniref:chaperone modulator CbpM n=1 Tax=Dactylosporangium sp. NPDC000244 TaxID=3154365 RepID=UPI00332BF08C